ncbi:MAG: molybdenum cofactor guanylyltransferase MobA [Pseudomonadota bacterium]
MSVSPGDGEALGIILAGGLARRMGGGDKGLLELGGRPILAHVIDRLRPQVAEMALNANGDPARFAAFGLPVLPDPVPGYPGPLAGVLAGLEHAAAHGLPWVVSVAADTPFFPAHLVTALRVAAYARDTRAAMAATEEGGRVIRHPVFALWPTDCRADLRAALAEGVSKVVAFSGPLGAVEVVFDAGPPDPFFNVNAPEDLARARELAREMMA